MCHKNINFFVCQWCSGFVLVVGIILGVPVLAYTQTPEQRIEDLERKIEIFSRELERMRLGDVFIKPGESINGMGPSASKVYKSDGVSIGGYGEGLYSNHSGTGDIADFLRAVLYFGYKYNKKWLLNTEIEFEHASTGKEGAVSVEFAYLDYLYRDELNFRIGLLLIPMGFLNELHEPTVFFSTRRPDVESKIIPTTWRENGLGFFGNIDSITYRVYVVNGLNARGFSPSGIRGGRQKGSKAIANELAGVVRVDWRPTTWLMVGGSVYYGDSGQEASLSVPVEMYEAHVEYRYRGLYIRALSTELNLSKVTLLNRILATPNDGSPRPDDSQINSIGEKMMGWYIDIGYDVLTHFDFDEHSLTPYTRVESYNTQKKTPLGFLGENNNKVDVITIGINFKPMDEIVFKADYQLYDHLESSSDNQFNLAMGYIF